MRSVKIVGVAWGRKLGQHLRIPPASGHCFRPTLHVHVDLVSCVRVCRSQLGRPPLRHVFTTESSAAPGNQPRSASTRAAMSRQPSCAPSRRLAQLGRNDCVTKNRLATPAHQQRNEASSNAASCRCRSKPSYPASASARGGSPSQVSLASRRMHSAGVTVSATISEATCPM